MSKQFFFLFHWSSLAICVCVFVRACTGRGGGRGWRGRTVFISFLRVWNFFLRSSDPYHPSCSFWCSLSNLYPNILKWSNTNIHLLNSLSTWPKCVVVQECDGWGKEFALKVLGSAIRLMAGSLKRNDRWTVTNETWRRKKKKKTKSDGNVTVEGTFNHCVSKSPHPSPHDWVHYLMGQRPSRSFWICLILFHVS